MSDNASVSQGVCWLLLGSRNAARRLSVLPGTAKRKSMAARALVPDVRGSRHGDAIEALSSQAEWLHVCATDVIASHCKSPDLFRHRSQNHRPPSLTRPWAAVTAGVFISSTTTKPKPTLALFIHRGSYRYPSIAAYAAERHARDTREPSQ